MKKKFFLGLVLVALSQTSSAVILTAKLYNNTSDSPVWSALAHLNGAIDKATGTKALYSENNFRVSALVIDTTEGTISLSDKSVFSDYDALILIGSPESNQDAAIELLGYGIPRSIVTIHHIKTPEDIEVSTYRVKEGTRAHRIAERVVRDIVRYELMKP